MIIISLHFESDEHFFLQTGQVNTNESLYKFVLGDVVQFFIGPLQHIEEPVTSYARQLGVVEEHNVVHNCTGHTPIARSY